VPNQIKSNQICVQPNHPALENVHGFYWYYRPLTVTALGIGAAPVVLTVFIISQRLTTALQMCAFSRLFTLKNFVGDIMYSGLSIHE